MTSKSVARVDLDLKINPAVLEAKERLAVVEGLRHAAEEVRTYAQELTPKDRGHLRASAEVVVDESALEAAIFYNTPYAVYQHERLDLNHPVGEAKFLEKALLAKSKEIELILAKHLAKVFK